MHRHSYFYTSGSGEFYQLELCYLKWMPLHAPSLETVVTLSYWKGSWAVVTPPGAPDPGLGPLHHTHSPASKPEHKHPAQPAHLVNNVLEGRRQRTQPAAACGRGAAQAAALLSHGMREPPRDGWHWYRAPFRPAQKSDLERVTSRVLLNLHICKLGITEPAQ